MSAGNWSGCRVGVVIGLIVVAMLLGPLSGTAQAHDTIKIGDYTVKWGWNLEPACVNQENAVWLEVTTAKNGSTVPVLGVEKALNITLISPMSEPREDALTPGEENGTYVGKAVIPTITGYYLLKLGGDILGTPADNTVKLDFVQPSGCLDFPPTKPPQTSDKVALEAARAAWAQSNATAAQVALLTNLVYAALGLGGAGVALAGYNAHLGRQSLAIARQKESRAKGEAAADELLVQEPLSGEKPAQKDAGKK